MCSTNTRTRSIEPETCGRQREGASWRGGCGSDLEGSSQLPIDEVCVVNNVQVWSVRGQLLEKALHVPQSVCDGAEVALHDAGHELVPVMLRHALWSMTETRRSRRADKGQLQRSSCNRPSLEKCWRCREQCSKERRDSMVPSSAG